MYPLRGSEVDLVWQVVRGFVCRQIFDANKIDHFECSVDRLVSVEDCSIAVAVFLADAKDRAAPTCPTSAIDLIPVLPSPSPKEKRTAGNIECDLADATTRTIAYEHSHLAFLDRKRPPFNHRAKGPRSLS